MKYIKAFIFFLLVGLQIVYSQDSILDSDAIPKSFTIKFERPKGKVLESPSYSIHYQEEFKNTSRAVIYTTSSRDTFVYVLVKNLKKLPENKRDLLFFIHGMWGSSHGNFQMISSQLESTYISAPQSDIGFILSFLWPANNMKYRTNKSNADALSYLIAEELFHLHKILNTLYHFSNLDTEQHLLCHSLGNYLYTKMIDNFPQEVCKHYPLFSETILAAPDLNTYTFEFEEIMDEISMTTQRLHIYYNHKDVTLRVSENLNGKRRMGQTGMTSLSKPKKNIISVDVSTLDDERSFADRFTSHSYYRNSPQVGKDMLDVFLHRELVEFPSRFLNGKKSNYVLQSTVEGQ